jgi:hypothetical protein
MSTADTVFLPPSFSINQLYIGNNATAKITAQRIISINGLIIP